MQVTYKIIELVHFKKPLGIYTVRRIESYSTGLEISDLVYKSTNREDCVRFIQSIGKV